MGRRPYVESPFPEGCAYKDGIYYSKWPAIPIPQDPYLDLVTYCLDHPYMDRVALVDAPTGQSMTYREFKHKVFAVAAGLADIGVKHGNVVMILSPNGTHFPVLVFAIAALGAVTTPVNSANLSSEIGKQVKDSCTKFIFSAPESVEKIAPLRLPFILIDTLVEGRRDQAKGFTPAAYLSELYKGDPSRAPKVRIKQTDLAMLLYSSGTTGHPKGVKLSHQNCIAAAAVLASDLNHDPGRQNIYLGAIPLYHVFGLIALCIPAIKKGGQFVIMPKFDFPKYLAAIETYRVTDLPVVPPILGALSKSPLVNKFNLSSLEAVGVGGAPASRELLEACTQRFEGVFVYQAYGMTETGGTASRCPAVSNLSVPHDSAGLLLPHFEAKIVDLDFGKPLPPNQSGELWLRGPSITEGYLNNDTATAEILDKDGWLHTGDIAYFDANGWLFIVDRLKELIKYNAYQVAPAELESVLVSHPAIEDAAVVGFPDVQTGQIPVAYVVRRSDILTEEDVIKFVAKQVAPYKKVRKVIFVESIPKSPAGKILRRQLKPTPTSKL